MTISRVSGQAGNATPVDGGASISRAFPSNVTSGNVVWFAAMAADTSHTFVAGDLTKSAGTATIESPVLLAVRNQDTGDGYFLPTAIWGAKVTGNGSLTLQASGLSSGGFWLSASDEIASTNGFAGSGGFAGTGNNNGTSANSNSPATTGLNTAASQSAMLIGAVGIGAGVVLTIGSPGGSWSTVYSEPDGTAHHCGTVVDQIVAASVTAQPSWSITGTTDGWAAALGVIVEQASSSGVGNKSHMDGVALSGIGAIDGVSKSGLSAITRVASGFKRHLDGRLLVPAWPALCKA